MMEKALYNVVYNRKKSLLSNGTALVQIEAYLDKPHENDPILPPQKAPHCRMKVTPVRRLKNTPLADTN